ncbi:MAG: hypothetical protein IVW55_10295 [Chloroflexi bacterium]|nr:hypothetical protein [Chloroflexota bacterium]
MLKRVIHNLGKADKDDAARLEPPELAKEGGHGDHWGCVVRSAEEGDLLAFIGRVVREVEQPKIFEARGAGVAACSPGEKLRACVLMKDERIASAYPEAQGGAVWPVTVKEVTPWANGIEGQITGDCYGATVSFFDTRFYANRRRYKVGESYNFYINAFAYTLGLASDMEVDTDMGAKVSLKGAYAYMPASLGNPGADIDDYWFHSPLDGDVSEAELAGKEMLVYPIIMAIPQDHELHVALYVARHLLGEGIEEAAPGVDLEGFLWLQGYLQEA